ncbi:MAG: dienelactone hydrolase family protein [Pseudomonadales bacterium]|nr:dienelactone hydrolase family protein [Pseudomonadales bacterium]
MGEIIKIKSGDGFVLDAYMAQPENAPKGAILVIQEVFGVNEHIRSVVDGYARDGYVAIAPALFDRVEAGIELGYGPDDMGKGVGIAFSKLKMPETLADLSAVITQLSEYGKVGVVGYCFGGLLTYLSACNLEGVACCSGYYGGGIVNVLDQKPKVPLILHFGELDAHIPMDQVDKIKSALPEVPVYVYNADHGFNCDMRDSYNKEASTEALKTTLEFFATHLS